MAQDMKIASIAGSKLSSKSTDKATKSLAGYILAILRHNKK